MTDIYIDDTKRKKIVSFWIPVCLGFLHFWATTIVIAVTVFDRHNATIDSMFSACGLGIAVLVFLLISNQGLELVRILITSKINVQPQIVEKTTTEVTTVKPMVTPVSGDPTQAQDVNINAENVNVN